MILSSGNLLVSAKIQASLKNLIMRYETDADGNVIYIGYAARGSETSWPVWSIEKHVNGHVPSVGGESYMLLSKENQIWDNRATVEFK